MFKIGILNIENFAVEQNFLIPHIKQQLKKNKYCQSVNTYIIGPNKHTNTTFKLNKCLKLIVKVI